jgi:site-specific DNA-methyltransferase (adenine-specific)
MSEAESKNLGLSPDILISLSNLSSDEIFTPPNLANEVLDLLPPECWTNPKLLFLDPSSKSGVFLREITKRLNLNLPNIFASTQDKIDHILSQQVFGIPVSSLTSHVTKRTLYNSRNANSESSLTKIFSNESGNILFPKSKHEFLNNKCKMCGVNSKNEDQAHLSPFLHNLSLFEKFKNNTNVIVTAPPFQIFDGGGVGSSAIPVYHRYVIKALELNADHTIVIIPSRWINGGKGLDEFRNLISNRTDVYKIIDFFDSREVFPSVQLAGGICIIYFKKSHDGSLDYTIRKENYDITNKKYMFQFADNFVRDPKSAEIVSKIRNRNKIFMDSIVRSRNPFNISSNFNGDIEGDVSVYTSKGLLKIKKEKFEYKNLDKFKTILSKASNESSSFTSSDGTKRIFAKIDILEPNQVCSESYLVIEEFDSKENAELMANYLKSKFCRFLVSTVLHTQNITKSSFCHVPHIFNLYQSDQQIYEYFKLNEEEINYIEKTIRIH